MLIEHTIPNRRRRKVAASVVQLFVNNIFSLVVSLSLFLSSFSVSICIVLRVKEMGR